MQKGRSKLRSENGVTGEVMKLGKYIGGMVQEIGKEGRTF
jgi:hypothetical protein